jgi:broad specificity polyphosphatase/5'/3'-nucleotidase SurE
MVTTSSTQGGLPNATARGKMAMGPSTAGSDQEQGQTNTNQAAESDDDVIEEIQGHPQDGDNIYTSAVNVETITSAMRRSPSMRRRKEWSEQLDGSSEKYM